MYFFSILENRGHLLCRTNESWNSIEGWIREIGVDEYKITNNKNVLDELEGAYWIDTIVLNVKKSIVVSKLKDNIPTIHQVKANTKLMNNSNIS